MVVAALFAGVEQSQVEKESWPGSGSAEMQMTYSAGVGREIP